MDFQERVRAVQGGRLVSQNSVHYIMHGTGGLVESSLVSSPPSDSPISLSIVNFPGPFLALPPAMSGRRLEELYRDTRYYSPVLDSSEPTDALKVATS